MHLAEMPDHHIAHPVSAAERHKAILAREKYLLNLSSITDKDVHAKSVTMSKYSKDIVKAGAAFLAVLAYCEKTSEDQSTEDAPAHTVAVATGTKRSHNDSNGNGTSSRKKPRNSLIASGTQVACLTEGEWILGHISRYVPESKKYEVLDDADDGEIYRIPRKNIRVLPIPKKSSNSNNANGNNQYTNGNGNNNSNHDENGNSKFKDNQRVLAVYPQTTVFYPAALVRKSGKNWLVEFDDEDANSSSVKEVPVHYVMCE